VRTYTSILLLALSGLSSTALADSSKSAEAAMGSLRPQAKKSNALWQVDASRLFDGLKAAPSAEKRLDSAVRGAGPKDK
jgi:hypothetical protein